MRSGGAKLRVLVVVQPFESHLRALWAVISALIVLGHDVRVAASPKLAQVIRDTYGFPYAEAGMDWSAAPAVAAGLAHTLTTNGNDAFCHSLIADHLGGPQVAVTTRDLLRITESWRPDVVISDITDFGSSLVAELLGILQLRFDNGWAGIFHDRASTLAAALAPHRAALALPETPADSGPELIFSPNPPGLLLKDLPNHTLVHYQHENPRRNGESLPEWVARLPPEKPLLYVSLGSILTRSPDFTPLLESHYARLIDAVAELDDCMTVVSVGPELIRAFRQRPNVRVVASVPQALLLQAGVSLFISHGGSSSIREAVLAGVPMLFLPISSDQPANAAQCAANGLGQVIPAGADSAEILRMIRAALAAPGSAATALHWKRQTLALPSIARILPRYLTPRKAA